MPRGGRRATFAAVHSRTLVAPLVVLLVAVACSSGDDDGSSPPEGAGASTAATTSTVAGAYEGYESDVYADGAHWLCRGDTDDDACDRDMDATIVRADGTTEIERWEGVDDAPVDCFYVYPTISRDDSANSDLVPAENQELYVVRQQAARLGSVCRVFAPVYRQVTLTALVSRLGGTAAGDGEGAQSYEIAYADVVDAWKHYMANDNGGRGVVLIGHSQGAGLLNRLIRDEIDGDEATRSRLVAAFLLGGGVAVPEGADVGGDFANVPLCRAPDDLGCVVSYASFRATAPPPAGSFFGRSRDGGRVACNNPASLAGGRATLRPYLPAEGRSLLADDVPTVVQWTTAGEVTTPFVTLPDFVEAECVARDGFDYLEITVKGDPSDPRIDDIGGDLTPEWGLHLVDVNVAMGDIVDLVADQADAYVAAR